MAIDTEINEKEKAESRNFIEQIIDKDLETGRFDHVQTRFPPEDVYKRQVMSHLSQSFLF